ncbi:MAG: hypothetical protein R2761_21415 [Acidimicrobiales bacterium]
MRRRWLVDGNNVFGSKPDGWWNNRTRAAERLTEVVAQWCRGHDDRVVLVFDPPVAPSVLELAGGNLAVEAAPRRGRDAADHHLVALAEAAVLADEPEVVVVVSSDKGLIRRLPAGVAHMGVGEFRTLVGY